MIFRLFLVALLMQPLFAFGSGTDSHRLYDPNGNQEVDEKFEQGKAIFTGRDGSAKKIRYCVFARGKLLKVKRSTVKKLKKLAVQEFEQSILDCDNPTMSAFKGLDDEQRKLVTYYLNKRFWLRLDGVHASY